MIALIGWWAAAVLGVTGWQVLNAALADGPKPLQQLGIWLIGFAALGAVVGWGASIGALLHDTGRVRAGAGCLIALPLVAAAMGWVAVSSTIAKPDDPLGAWWLVLSGLLLLIGTLLICLPEHLGTG